MTGGDIDYSNWFFNLNSNYTSIQEGMNEITAKLSCLPDVVGNNITKWYSINITGIAKPETINSESIPSPQLPPAINSRAQAEPKNSESQSLDSDVSGVEESPTSNINDKIEEETESLKDRIMEQVEENLREKGIELNLP
jgi:hypothetical protein